MPFINSQGRIAHGVGGGNASVDNVPFCPGGVGGWLTDDEVCFTNGNDGWVASAYNVKTGVIRQLHDPGSTAPDPENLAYASGDGHWAVWLAGTGPARGIHSDMGLRAPDGGLMGIGPAGAIGYKPSYQSMGPTVVREADGSEWQLTAGSAGVLQLFGQRRALWMEGVSSIFSANMPTPQVVPGGGIYKVLAAFAGGQWWTSYYSVRAGIVLHPFNSFNGYSILPVGDGWHNIRAISDDVICVAVARHEAEAAGDIWGYNINVRTNTVTELYTGKARPDVALMDVSTIVPPAPTASVAKLPRPVWTGYVYSISDQYGDNMNAPGSAQIVIEPAAAKRAIAAGKSIIVSANCLYAGMPADKLVAIWIHAATVEDIEAQIPQIRAQLAALSLPARPIMAYLDSDTWPRLPNPAPDWYNPRVYCKVGETPDQLKNRVVQMLATFPANAVLTLMCQAYNTNDTLTRDLLSIQPVFPELARADARIRGIFWFSDGRSDAATGRGGTRSNESIRPWHAATVAASPGVPALDNAAAAPGITIASYDSEVFVGTPAHASATLSGGPATTIDWLWRPSGTSNAWTVGTTNPANNLNHPYLWQSPGSYDIAARVNGPGGTSQTGAKRTVTVHAPSTPTPTPDPPTPTPDPPVPPTPTTTPTPAPPPAPKQSLWTTLRKLSLKKILKALGI